MAKIYYKGENYYAYRASTGLGEVNTSASKKCNQITQVCYFRPPVAQFPCPRKKDAAITVISQISCILRVILGVNMKNQEPSRKISKAGNRNRLYIGKDSYLGLF